MFSSQFINKLINQVEGVPTMPNMKFANIEDQYKKHPNLRKADVLSLLQWCSMQPHLPKIDELEAVMFWHNCFGSNEAAKKRIDNYFTYRTHCPEFFANCDPNSAELQLSMDAIATCVLPKATPKDELIFYSRFLNTNPDAYNFNTLIKTFEMVISLYLYENGCFNGHIFVIDLGGTHLRHLLKTNAFSLKKVIYYLQNAAPLRSTGIHFVNGVSFMDKVMALVKPLLKKKLQELVHVHFDSNETIFKYIPKECLPIECGGDCGSIRDIFAIQRKHLENNASFFTERGKQLVDESKRPGKPKNIGDLFGVEGTFKKLDLD